MAPFARTLQRWRLPNWACVTLAALLCILPLAGFIYLIIVQAQALVLDWPRLSTSVFDALDKFRRSEIADRFRLARAFSPEILQAKLQAHFGSELMVALTSLEKIFSAGALLLLTMLFAIAMVASRQHLNRAFGYLVLKYTDIESTSTVTEMATMMESFLVARTVIAVGLGIACLPILLGFGISYSFLLATFLGVMTWVPVVGLLVGIFPVVVVGFASGKSPLVMLVVFLAISVLWAIQDNIITPKWVGHRLKLNFLATYVAFFAGGLVWGAWGMILSIPLLGVLRIACDASPALRPWAFLFGEDQEMPSEFPIQAVVPSSKPS